MSEHGGFDPGWLALREPYDHAARDPGLTRALGGALSTRPGPWRLIDLGCGAGSSLRYLAPALGGAQDWTLVDHDPMLLDRARSETLAWASRGGRPTGSEGPWTAVGDWRLRTRRLDLRGGSLAPPGEGPWDAVVTSALLDLVSSPWLSSLSDWLAQQRIPFLAALTVDGRIRWDPEDPDDAMVHGWFRDHQRTDRGFGPSPGPQAADELATLLRARGFEVRLEAADWQIRSDREPGPEMLGEMIRGIASAAAEMSPASRVVEGWRHRRLVGIERGCVLRVGHQDLLALPRD